MFHKENELHLTESQKNEARTILLNGIAERASIFFILFGIGSLVYGFQTIDILKLFDPSLTLIDNVLPRVLYSSIPCFTIALMQRKYLQSINLKIYLWAIGFPIIFTVTCLINVWPIIYAGNVNAYLYFHAANMFCLTLSFLLVAPSIKLFVIHLIAFVMIFFIPLFLLLAGNANLTSLLINDSLSSLAISFACSYFLFNLRKKIQHYDIKFKDTIKPFLGKKLINAITSETLENLSNFKTKGIILTLDLRGFTAFIKSYDSNITSQFMKEYHNLISQTFITNGGYLHKSNGDGHIFSFGVMDDIDLSDLSVLQSEIKNSEERKIKSYIEIIDRLFPIFVNNFYNLMDKFDLPPILEIGAGLDVGMIRLILQGDIKTKMELDIEGEVIIRSTRLEAYSKVLNKVVPNAPSFLILTDIAHGYLTHSKYIIWQTSSGEMSIRDFPDIKNIFYKAWSKNINNNNKQYNAA